VNGIVSIEPFIHQTLERLWDHRRVTKGHLVLDDRVDRTMQLGTSAEREVIAAVIVDGQIDPFGFIECEPCPWIGRLTSIVAHGQNSSYSRVSEAKACVAFELAAVSADSGIPRSRSSRSVVCTRSRASFMRMTWLELAPARGIRGELIVVVVAV
jgi:hypothetical protein